MQPDIAIIILQFLDTINSRTHSFLLLYLNGANLIGKLIFKMNFLSFIMLRANSIFDIHNSYGIKLLTKLFLGLSHPHNHKLRHWFLGTLNPLCDCGKNAETITHFSLHCPSFHIPRQNLLNNIRNINEQILSHSENQLIQTFLYGNPNCNLTVTILILNAKIEYLTSKVHSQV